MVPSFCFTFNHCLPIACSSNWKWRRLFLVHSNWPLILARTYFKKQPCEIHRNNLQRRKRNGKQGRYGQTTGTKNADKKLETENKHLEKLQQKSKKVHKSCTCQYQKCTGTFQIKNAGRKMIFDPSIDVYVKCGGCCITI